MWSCNPDHELRDFQEAQVALVVLADPVDLADKLVLWVHIDTKLEDLKKNDAFDGILNQTD